MSLNLKTGIFPNSPDTLIVADVFDVDGDLLVRINRHDGGDAHTWLKPKQARKLRKHLKRALKARDQ